jgi:hypothetical protein
MLYFLKDQAYRQLDLNNKPRHYFNIAVVSVLASASAFIALPMPDTSLPPKPEPVAVEAPVAKPEKSPEEIQATRLQECEAAEERKSLRCQKEQTNSVCQIWMDQVRACHKLRK